MPQVQTEKKLWSTFSVRNPASLLGFELTLDLAWMERWTSVLNSVCYTQKPSWHHTMYILNLIKIYLFLNLDISDLSFLIQCGLCIKFVYMYNYWFFIYSSKGLSDFVAFGMKLLKNRKIITRFSFLHSTFYRGFVW